MRNCIRGYSCGNTCISVSFECPSEFPDGVSFSIDGTKSLVLSMGVNENPKPKTKKLLEPEIRPLNEEELTKLIEKFENIDDGSGFSFFYNDMIALYDSPDGKNNTSVELSLVPESKAWAVSFTINDKYDTSDEMSLKEKIVVGKNVKKNWEKILAEFPEGSVFTQTSYNEDGKGKNRARAYQKNGFQIFEDKRGEYYGYAMKVGNKLVPYTPSNEETSKPVEFVEIQEVTAADYYTMVTGEIIE